MTQKLLAALEAILAARYRRQLARRYAKALPETDAELADATRLAVESIRDEPWDRWW
jgi:hypothetical protein